MKKTNKIILISIVAIILILGIGYAAIQNITLNIKGTAKADPSQSNFKVMFSGTPIVSDQSKMSASVTDDINATINVTGLTAKGETVIATYTVQNASTDISADLSVATTNSNTEYFTIRSEFAKTSLIAGETTTLTVTVTLTKTPISENVSSSIGVQITAYPIEPGKEGTSGNTNSSSQTGNDLIGAYLPVGCNYVSGTSLLNGLTVESDEGNQYVWIEVPKTNEVYATAGLDIKEFTEAEYTAIETDLCSYTSSYRNTPFYTDQWISEEATGLTEKEYYELKNKMLKSIYQKGGFYVGKYETGTETARTSGSITSDPTEIPVIKANVYPYNYVTISQAQKLASSISEEGNTTSLMFGIQWDLMMKYLETSGISIESLTKNSTSFGNYQDNLWTTINVNSKYQIFNSNTWNDGIYSKTSNSYVLLSTGASEDFNMQGIYDLAGNVWEWTLESYGYSDNYPSTCRGGVFVNKGTTFPTGCHAYFGPTDLGVFLGFRVSLY